MKTTEWLRAGLVGLVLAGASVHCGSPVGQLSDPMVGTPSNSTAFVVRVDGVPSCTGLAIGPHMLLTARHCLSLTATTVDCTTPVILGNYPLSELSIASSDGSQVWPATAIHYADEVSCDQGAFDTHVECTLCGYDVAVIEVATPLTATPFGIDWTTPTGSESFDILGLSCQNCSDAQAVSATRLAPESVDGQEIFLMADVCSGDSGAGLFVSANSNIVGVLSRGNSECTQGAFERLDTLRPWLTTVGVDSGDSPSWTGVEPIQDAATDAASAMSSDPVLDIRATGSCVSSGASPAHDDQWVSVIAVLAGTIAVRRRRIARLACRS